DPLGEPGAGDVAGGHLGVPRVVLQGDQPPVGGQGAAQPDGAVAAERADLQDPAGALHRGEEVQELAVGGGDGDGREPGGRAVAQRGRQGVVGGVGEEAAGEVVVHLVPLLRGIAQGPVPSGNQVISFTTDQDR